MKTSNNTGYEKDIDNRDPQTSAVYPPWSRQTIFSDGSVQYHRGYLTTDIENDGYPEQIFMMDTYQMFIMNYSGGTYNTEKIDLSFLSTETLGGFVSIDYNRDGVQEIYLFTYEDKITYWQTKIWQGIRVDFNTWNWADVLTYNDSNVIYHTPYAFDLDGDGILEILPRAENEGSGVVEVPLLFFEYQVEKSTFTNFTIDKMNFSQDCGFIYVLAIGDIDNDGKDEIYTCIRNNTNGIILQYRFNTSSKNWESYIIIEENADPYYYYWIVIGDGDNDGENELFYSAGQKSKIYLGEYNGTDFNSTLLYSKQWNGHPQDINILDINNDGLNELVVGHDEICCDGAIRIFNGSGSNWDEFIVKDGLGDYTDFLQIVDLNMDGLLEIYQAAGYTTYRNFYVYTASGFPTVPTPPQYYVSPMTFHLPIENGSAKLEWNPSYANNLQNYHLQVSETHDFSSIIIDNDTIPANQNYYLFKPFSVELNKSYWFRVSAINGTGEGSFSTPFRFKIDSSAWVIWNISVGGGFVGLTSGDFNGDGIIDIAGHNMDGYTYAFDGKTAKQLWNLSFAINEEGRKDILSLDIDHDGDDDILTIGPDSIGASSGYVKAHYGHNGSTIWSVNLNGGPHSIALGDFDDDGIKDEIAVAEPWPGRHIIILEKNGSQIWNYTNCGAGYINVADINADGYDDVITSAGWPDNTVYTVNHTGELIYSLPIRRDIFSMGDVNGDNSLELVLSTSTGAKFIYMYNSTGDLIWNIDPLASSIAAINTGDLNGDSKDEIIFSTETYICAYEGDTLNQLWNRSINFRYDSHWSTFFSDIVIEDIDGDGSLEVITVSEDGYLYVLDGSSGEDIKKVQLGGSANYGCIRYFIQDGVNNSWSRIAVGTNNGTLILLTLYDESLTTNIWQNNWTDFEGVKWTYRVPITVSNGTNIDYENYQTSLFIGKSKVSGGQIRVVKNISNELWEVPCYVQDKNNTHYRVWWQINVIDGSPEGYFIYFGNQSQSLRNYQIDDVFTKDFDDNPLLEYQMDRNNEVAMDFDGDTDYILIPSNSTSGTYTFTWWQKRTNNGYVFDAKTGRLVISNGQYTTAGYTDFYDGSWKSFGPGSYTETNKWYFKSIVFDSYASKAYCYLNGVYIDEQTYIPKNLNGTSVSISDLGITGISGSIDEWRIYERNLSIDEIRNIMLDSNPTTTNLWVYYSFEDNNGNIAIDRSGNGNNGTIINAKETCTFIYDSSKDENWQVMEFDGSGDYVNLTTGKGLYSTFDNEWAISTWVKHEDDDEEIFCYFGEDGTISIRVIYNNGWKFRTAITQSDVTNIFLWSNFNRTLGVWYHVIFQNRNNTLELYINGEYKIMIIHMMERIMILIVITL